MFHVEEDFSDEKNDSVLITLKSGGHKMSRSRKKWCAGGNCGGSNYEWFRKEHRRERRIVNQLLNTFHDDTLLPHPTKKYCDPWDSPQDGKHIYWFEGEYKAGKLDVWAESLYKKFLRK